MRSMYTTIRTGVTANDLDEIMGIGSVVTIVPGNAYDVTVIGRPDVWEPEAIWSDTDVRHIEPVTDWTPLHGHSGSAGPSSSAILEPAEFIGGGLARHLIDEAREDGGCTYATVEVTDPDDEEALIGWAILRYEPTTTKEN